MTRKRQPAVLTRKSPQQARAQVTVNAIFDATARILERKGPSSLNTNAIAQHAGISVGTLYGYFSSKEAILVSMAQRQLEEDQRNIAKVLSDALDNLDASPARRVIGALVKLHSDRPELRRVIMAAHFAHGLGAEHAKIVQIVAEILAARSGHIRLGAANPSSHVTFFVLTRAVIGVLRAVFEERSPLLASQELEDELVNLIHAYLALPAERKPRMAS